MIRPEYCEECPLYPHRCSGADCYFDHLEAIIQEKAEEERSSDEQ